MCRLYLKLDLGVDFSPVDQVVQIGSPKGIARLLQRAGRGGHQPGQVSRVVCVPTHAFELVEAAAARMAAGAGSLEERNPLEKPLDVLVQHIVTLAVGGGFEPTELYQEVRTTHAYKHLPVKEWDWILDFVSRGGRALRAYPEFHRVSPAGFVYRVVDERVAQRHRISIGTITSDEGIPVRYRGGKKLGTIESAFAAKLRRGDRFSFAGHILELIGVRDSVA